MRNTLLILTVIAAFVLFTLGTGSVQAANESFPKVISLGTGSVGGGYNMVGVGAAKIWDKELGVKAKVAPGLSLSNLQRFAAGRLDTVVSPSSWGIAAYNGMEEYGFPKPIQSFRVLCYIFPDFFHFVTLKKSGLKNIGDLKGKRVGCGPKAATYDKIVGKRLEANGITYFGDNPAIKKTFSNYNDLARLLGDGNIDATIMGLSGVAPFPALQKLMEEKEIVALEWSKSALDYEYPVFPVGVIKKELLPYLEKDHSCILGGIASIIVRQDFSDEFAYALVKSIHQNLPKIAEENPYWKYPTRYPEIMTYDSGLPYHPGAIKYWKEVGAWKR